MASVIATVEPLEDNRYGDDKPLFEIIDGLRVDLPPMSILGNRIVSNLFHRLAFHLDGNLMGEAVAHMLFRLPLPVDRNRRPDVAFVSAQALRNAPPQLGSENAWAVLPELMGEVVSPRDLAEEVMERLGEYFAAGTKLVWVVYPTQRLVYVYESLQRVRVLTEADNLDGGSVLPELRIPIASLFPRT